MSLDERMAGVMSANKPIDAEFCQRVGMRRISAIMFRMPFKHGIIDYLDGELVIRDSANRLVFLPSVNTQGRFLHLLAALGIEVPG